MDPPDVVLTAMAEIRVFAPPGLLVMVNPQKLTALASVAAAEADGLPTLDEAVKQLETTYARTRRAGAGVPEFVRVRVTQEEVDNLLDKKAAKSPKGSSK